MANNNSQPTKRLRKIDKNPLHKLGKMRHKATTGR